MHASLIATAMAPSETEEQWHVIDYLRLVALAMVAVWSAIGYGLVALVGMLGY